MKLLTLLVGPPGSGKSTFAKKLIYEDGDHGAMNVYINQDTQGADHIGLFDDAVRAGKPVIVDRMNFNKAQRSRYIDIARLFDYKVKIVVLHENFLTCMERMKNRKDHPSIKDEKTASKALNFFFSKYERVEDSEAEQVVRIWPDEPKMEAIICDLDGTLCNIEHRRHFVRPEEGKKKDWKSFFEGIPNDSVNRWCADLLNAMSVNFHIVYCTGRDENQKGSTVQWLRDHKLYSFYDPKFEIQSTPYLFMRNRSDSRQDYIIKEILLDFEILTRFDPYFIIDDRDQVVEMWRRRGFTVLQCAKGDF